MKLPNIIKAGQYIKVSALQSCDIVKKGTSIQQSNLENWDFGESDEKGQEDMGKYLLSYLEKGYKLQSHARGNIRNSKQW